MTENKIEIGLVAGEVCGRAGCAGIIEEGEKEGSCSCHINPPCGYCTTDSHYCPICDWQASDQPERELSQSEKEYYEKENQRWAKQCEDFYSKFRTGEGIEKLEIRNEPHTHFTQKLVGIFPAGTETEASVLPKVIGTFGGRFTRFEKYRFEYIAYTD